MFITVCGKVLQTNYFSNNIKLPAKAAQAFCIDKIQEMELNSVTIKGLLESVPHQVHRYPKGNVFAGVESDSRKVGQGFIFLAIKGQLHDGHAHALDSIKRGATLVIFEDHSAISTAMNQCPDVGFVQVGSLRQHIGIIASNFYGWPQKRLTLIGVTGTNGKTTTTYIISSILGEQFTARVGTIQTRIGTRVLPAVRTTPEALDLLRIMSESVQSGMKYLVMEVSSHGLELGRVNMLDFDVAAFTNLTPDHLDFHQTMENYFQAKRKLFLRTKDKTNCVFNMDSDYGRKLMQEFRGISYSSKGQEADLSAVVLKTSQKGLQFQLKYGNQSCIARTNLIGRYNLENVLAAVGVCLKIGIPLVEIAERLGSPISVPGRLERIENGQNFSVFVDFAHTGDGLEQVLATLAEIKTNRLIVVFGCGGERPRERRLGMGQAASKLSDFAIITADNSRGEKFEDIAGDILEGFNCQTPRQQKQHYIVIEDRACAIKAAVEMAQPEDIILIAGKGHETTQTAMGKTDRFDDREQARQAIRQLLGMTASSPQQVPIIS